MGVRNKITAKSIFQTSIEVKGFLVLLSLIENDMPTKRGKSEVNRIWTKAN